ncbi:Sulfotransferase 1C4 [Chionoecetes opilio]|uniref:Sulfotransferase 1C4 n=1 Tax=Chionoecetes opilio TaxID=41210 RepID=A0A8J5CER5_CHIOP|nr:Sulfotransferase 1C4 [Chionoecetes opilio]
MMWAIGQFVSSVAKRAHGVAVTSIVLRESGEDAVEVEAGEVERVKLGGVGVTGCEAEAGEVGCSRRAGKRSPPGVGGCRGRGRGKKFSLQRSQCGGAGGGGAGRRCGLRGYKKGLVRLPGLAFKKCCPGRNPADGVNWQLAECIKEPRTIKTHLPFSLVTPSLLDTCKYYISSDKQWQLDVNPPEARWALVVYVARNPKDMVVSYHHHSRISNVHGFDGTLDDFVQYFEFTCNKVSSLQARSKSSVHTSGLCPPGSARHRQKPAGTPKLLSTQQSLPVLPGPILENLVPNPTAISDLSAQHINPRTGRKARRTLPSDAPARIKTLLSTSLPLIGPKLFNNLPGKLRNLTECSVEKFKHHLDNHLQTIPDEPPVPGYTSVSRADTNSISDQMNLQYRDAGFRCSGGAPRL